MREPERIPFIAKVIFVSLCGVFGVLIAWGSLQGVSTGSVDSLFGLVGLALGIAFFVVAWRVIRA